MASFGMDDHDEAPAEPPVVHPFDFDRVSGRGWPGKPKVTLEQHLDAQGRKRLFRIEESYGPSGAKLVAEEVRGDEPTGWTFTMSFDDEIDPPPYGDLRFRIAERLAGRDLVRDPDTGTLALLDRLIRARIVAPADAAAKGPDLIIDGDRVSWADLGLALAPYDGWGLRVELTDGGEE